jgi:hypothetical protein
MRVDRRHYVGDLALAATRFGALGLNPAAYAQGLNTLADVRNPKFVLDPLSPKPLPAQWAATPVSGADRNRSSQQAINKPLMGGSDGEEDT